MTTVRNYRPRAAGVPWVRKEDYAAFLAICEDAAGFPATWEQFARLTEEAERRYEADGTIIERAYIDPETFPDWCAAHGARVNSQGRMKFAACAVRKYCTNQS